jgi:hypothetical protein
MAPLETTAKPELLTKVRIKTTTDFLFIIILEIDNGTPLKDNHL